ncbi:hypothetical protein DIZ76_012861 [Coccidioides immitis]|nr:hypothetical protein DIZ76_012861 [Coccidioides immitis]
MSTSKLRAARLGTKLENRKCRSTQPSTRTLNKGHDASITSTPLKSKAAKFNTHTLRKLQAAVDNDPEINLITQMPLDYSIRLVEFQGECREESKEIIGMTGWEANTYARLIDVLRQRSPRPQKDVKVTSVIAFDLRTPLTLYGLVSSTVLGLLEETSQIAEPLPDGLPQRMLDLVRTSEVIWKSPVPDQMMVFKCDTDVVVKAIRRVDDDTEYTTLQYLECHKPDIPAPRPLGYVRMSGITLIFQTYKPSTTLATVWPQMDNDQKASIRDQLGAIMSNLRSIPYTDGSALGGVAGEGCKDIRRHLRKSEKPIRSLVEFEEFLFSSPHPGGQVFTELLRQLLPDSTHGDEDCFHAR